MTHFLQAIELPILLEDILSKTEDIGNNLNPLRVNISYGLNHDSSANTSAKGHIGDHTIDLRYGLTGTNGSAVYTSAKGHIGDHVIDLEYRAIQMSNTQINNAAHGFIGDNEVNLIYFVRYVNGSPVNTKAQGTVGDKPVDLKYVYEEDNPLAHTFTNGSINGKPVNLKYNAESDKTITGKIGDCKITLSVNSDNKGGIINVSGVIYRTESKTH